MRNVILLAAGLLLLVVGCKRVHTIEVNNQPPAAPAPATPSTPPLKEEGPPPLPKAQPVPPVVPSSHYLKGYSDGYHGTWLAPVQWVALGEYRNGWSAGHFDRVHALPNRYPR